MGRFLIFFSYIGTHYRGMQIQREAGDIIQRFKTVQGVLEEHLRKLKPANEVTIKTSSRTDSNVHALCNTCHVDLTHRHHPQEFNPLWITSKLNYNLIKSNEKLRILNTVRVPDEFSSRYEATERSYVYRLAIVKTIAVFTDPACRGIPWNAQDADLSSRVFTPFDLDLFLKAAEILSGTHNFLSFSTKNFVKSGRKFVPHAQLRIRVQRSCAWMEEHRPTVSDSIDYWEVHFHGRSFLYKQVRRMMGAMVMVARGKMTLEELQHHLDHPSLKNPGKIQALPGFGLILKEVHYPEHVFSYGSKPQEQPSEEPSVDDLQSSQSPGLQETVPSQEHLFPSPQDTSTYATSLSVVSEEATVQEGSGDETESNERTCTDDARERTCKDGVRERTCEGISSKTSSDTVPGEMGCASAIAVCPEPLSFQSSQPDSVKDGEQAVDCETQESCAARNPGDATIDLGDRK